LNVWPDVYSLTRCMLSLLYDIIIDYVVCDIFDESRLKIENKS